METQHNEKNKDNNINEDYGFEIGLQLQNNPFEFVQSNEKEEMKETVLDNIIRQSSIKKENDVNSNNNNNNFENINVGNSSIISPNEMGEILKSLKQNNLISNKKFIDLSHENDYLKSRELRKVKNEIFNSYLQSINYQEIQKLTNYILNNINFKINESNSYSINPCVRIFRLVEASFGFDNNKINEMKQKLNLLSDYSFYRRVKGDGNCYYRAIIFKYLEIIIFNNNIELMKDLILDVEECFEDKKIKNKLNIGTTDFIKPILVKNILTAIYFSMIDNDILKAYKLLNISINTCRKFDMGLILYFRYVLYKYINENKNKLYTKNFGVKIGNLLPGEYETDDGIFLFEEFYENYLLKLFNDAEKIVIYLTPFVFPIKLNIILYDGKQQDIFQEFYSPDNKDCNNVISILNKKVHYEIVYSNIEFNKFYHILQLFTNNQIKPRCLPMDYMNYNFNNNNSFADNNYQNSIHLNNNNNIQKENNQQDQSFNFQNMVNNNNNNGFILSNNLPQTINITNQINSLKQDINTFFIGVQENNARINYNNQMNYNQNNNQINYNQNNNQINYNQNNNQINYNQINNQINYNQNNNQMNYNQNNNQMNYNQNNNQMNYNQNNNQMNCVQNNNKMNYSQMNYNQNNNYNQMNYTQNDNNINRINNNSNNFQSDNGMINQNNNNFKSDDSVSNQNNNNYQSENGLNNNNNCYNFQSVNGIINYNNYQTNNSNEYYPQNSINGNLNVNNNISNQNNSQIYSSNELNNNINNQISLNNVNQSQNHQINQHINNNDKVIPMGNISYKKISNIQQQNTYYPKYSNDNKQDLDNKNNTKTESKSNIKSYDTIEEFLNDKKNDENLNDSSINQKKNPHYNQLSNISSNNKNENENLNNKNKIITPQKSIIYCNICKKPNNDFFPNSQICIKCFNEGLLREIHSKYFKYLDDISLYFQDNQKITTNIFYVQKFYEIMDRLCIYDITVNFDILSKNNYDINNFISIVKKKICLNCQKAMGTNECIYEIPCKCCFCSLDCLKQLFSKHIIIKNLKSDLFCLCSHIYEPNELYQLGQCFKKYNLIDFSNQIKQKFNLILTTHCAKCKKSYKDNSLMQPIYYEDSEDNKNSNKPLGKYDDLLHYLCLGCFNSLSNNKTNNNFFNCEFCLKEHHKIKLFSN